MNPQDAPDICPDAETSYKALRRAIQRGVGFSLLFVRCTPVKGEEIVKRIKNDLPQKKIEVLDLDANTENLYHLVANLSEEQSFDVLFIRGLEESLFQYEDREQLGILERSKGTGYGGNWESIPRILGHLNLSRERFRDNFKLCFVFLLPEFALNYFIRRAPDFFDWRSNVYEFSTDEERLNREAYRLVYFNGNYQEYRQQTIEKRIAKLAEIKSYISETSNPERNSKLWFQKGLIHSAKYEDEEAIDAYDHALQKNPEYRKAWNNRGNALKRLGRYEEAIASFDRALKINPLASSAYYNKACTYARQNEIELVLKNLKKAIQLNPNRYREMAKNEDDFHNIRHDLRFQALIKL